MDIKESYNLWASQYDSNQNKTRDLEGEALRITLADIKFHNCLEVGCGTGKNTQWLMQKAVHLTAVDLSEEMLEKAKQKIKSNNVDFIQADILKEWSFTTKTFDLITFSLVLEHIENLEPVFEQVSKKLSSNGYVYVGELHPYKQYAGSKARFETEKGLKIIEGYIHHLSDYIQSAKKHGLKLVNLNEFFDAGENELPRILTMFFQKS